MKILARTLVISALCLMIQAQLVAADSTPTHNNSQPTPEPSKAYTDSGTTTYQPTTSTYDGFNNNYYSNGFRDPLYNNSITSRITIQNRPIYFPPTPPALGEADFKQRIQVSLAKLAPPSALAKDVYEPFYAPLSTLLFTEEFSKKRREKLDGYHTARTDLLNELRAKLDALHAVDSSARETGLATLAQEQAPRLTALEASAEELRSNFTRGSFFESGVDWNDTRNWRLGDDTRWESQIDEIKVMRAAVAFQDGLSADQRRLLREIEMELGDGLRGPTDEIALSTPGPFIYFSPETARIRLPAEMPDDLAAKIETYKNQKTELKKDLRALVYQQDRAWFAYKRVNTLKALADKQAPQFAAVEKLAEEIRDGLALLPNPAKPPALPLPASLVPRIDNYHRQKTALQAMMVAKQEEIKNALPNDRVEYTRLSDSFVLSVIPNRQASPATSEKRSSIMASLPAFNQEQTKLYLNLAREKEAIRQEIMKTVHDLSAKKSIDQLLREFSYAFKQQEVWDLYREYEIAVLQPGLSPSQRQLLFGAAIEKLDLPLAN